MGQGSLYIVKSFFQDGVAPGESADTYLYTQVTRESFQMSYCMNL